MSCAKVSKETGHIKSAFKHALIYSLSGILAKAVGFVMLPVYAHFLRGEGYGIIGMIDVVLSVLVMLIGYGVQSAMSRLYYDREGELKRQQLVSTAIFLMFCLVFAVALPLIGFSEQVALLAFGKEGLGVYISLAGFTFIADMTSKNAETYILIRQKSVFYAFLSLLRLILGLSLNILFIVKMEMGVLGYLYSGLVVAVVFSIVMHAYAFINVGLHFDRDDAISILRFSLPLVPGYVAMFIRTNTDRILLRSYLGLSMLGAFEMLFKFATLIGFLVVEPFAKIWGVKRFEIAELKEGPVTLASNYTIQLSFMLFFGLILSVEIPVILKILTPEEFWLGGVVAGLAVFSRIILASYYHFYFGLLYAQKTHKISIIQMITTVANIVFAVALIKPLGILGAVIVSCLTNSLQCVLGYLMARKEYMIPFEWGRVVTIVLFSILLFLGINSISLSSYPSIEGWLVNNCTRPMESLLVFVHLDSVRDGKLLHYALANIPLLTEGCGKLIFCLGFLGGLALSGILPKRVIAAALKSRSLSPILTGMR